ncbi:hypothetical protein AYX22_17800 [Arthrobacter sp. D5-1]|nr:hypothetical protein AYX22_17800 [Arthrobacter sp. D5-1]
MYEEYLETGIEQREFGAFPKVVWAMDAYRPNVAERRRQAFSLALNRSTRVTPELYRISALAEASTQLVREVRHD